MKEIFQVQGPKTGPGFQEVVICRIPRKQPTPSQAMKPRGCKKRHFDLALSITNTVTHKKVPGLAKL